MLVDKTMTFNKGTLYILESGVVRFVLKYLCIKFRSAAVVTNWLVNHRRMLKCFRKLHLKFQEQISHVLLQNYVTNSCMVWYSIWCTLIIIDDTRRQPSLCLSSSGSKLTCFTYLSIAIDIYYVSLSSSISSFSAFIHVSHSAFLSAFLRISFSAFLHVSFAL